VFKINSSTPSRNHIPPQRWLPFSPDISQFILVNWSSFNLMKPDNFSPMKKYPLRTLIYVITTGVCLLAGRSASGQTNSDSLKRNAVYFELLGPGILYSLNYDYRITERLAIRAGFTHWTISFFGESTVTGFPIMMNYLSGKNNRHFEAGIGFVPTLDSEEKNSWFSVEDHQKKETDITVIGTINLGYRYQPRNGGLVFRINFSPLFGPIIIPWVGMSFGYGF
jgi:hypothetical protein